MSKGSTPSVPEEVRDYYETRGWREKTGLSEDARRWEDFRPNLRAYIRGCRLRLLEHMPGSGDRLLDVGSGPVQYPEYLELSSRFREHHCVDLSARALEAARERLGGRAVTHLGDFLELDLPKKFDAALALHVLFHVERDLQETFVRKLLAHLKPGGVLVVVTSNPRSLASVLVQPLVRIKSLFDRIRGRRGFYYHAPPLGWWSRFRGDAEVTLHPYRLLGGQFSRRFLPDLSATRRCLEAVERGERARPGWWLKIDQYSLIRLVKRGG